MTGANWTRFCRYWCDVEAVGLSLDVSRMGFADGSLDELAEPMCRALAAMRALEAGAMSNPDEQRRVGHYWLRAPELAPEPEMRAAIEACLVDIAGFAADVHVGRVAPQRGGLFRNLLVVGIGGSTLGPQFVDDALGNPDDKMRAFFCDNTDPDGMDRLLARLGHDLAGTLTLVVSKSGGTKETRNGMLEVARAYATAGLDFARHAVAITSAGSALDKERSAQGWLRAFPMWDWVGGRTSQTSAVGLLPAALQGFDFRGLLAGARDMDAATRQENVLANPAALLAAMWYWAGRKAGLRDMVVLPYKDRLLLFPRYLQQLIMESLGKECDLAGAVVHEGLSVYGNKGSTDQHAYVQQLRDGLANFFVAFIEVLSERRTPAFEVEPGFTSGDYLHGFLVGTREALSEKQRPSLTINIAEVSARTVGALIALFERAVGLYAALVNINAYHQPGVEAGKKAAGQVLDVQRQVVALLRKTDGPRLAEEIAAALGPAVPGEWVYGILEHLAAGPARGIRREGPRDPRRARFTAVQPGGASGR